MGSPLKARVQVISSPNRRLVVRAYPGKAVGPWYYKGEDPRNDMRGFHVDKLNFDPEDAKLDAPGLQAAAGRRGAGRPGAGQWG